MATAEVLSNVSEEPISKKKGMKRKTETTTTEEQAAPTEQPPTEVPKDPVPMGSDVKEEVGDGEVSPTLDYALLKDPKVLLDCYKLGEKKLTPNKKSSTCQMEFSLDALRKHIPKGIGNVVLPMQKLTIETPTGKFFNGINALVLEDEEAKGTTHTSYKCSLTIDMSKPDHVEFLEFCKAFDESIIQLALARKMEFFKKDHPEAAIRVLYSPLVNSFVTKKGETITVVRFSIDYVYEENKPTDKLRLQVFDPTFKETDYTELFQKTFTGGAIFQLRSVWIAGKGFGCKAAVMQIQYDTIHDYEAQKAPKFKKARTS